MKRFLLVREHSTFAGIRTVPVRGIGGSDSLVLHGPSEEHVIKNANKLGLWGVKALELDENDRPVRRQRGAA